jgi:metal-responsive CopG/Arc/MetJ family transcriptional regulator
MRTTIEIPAKLRQKLVAEAAKKNLKGSSTIIVNALEEYFEKHRSAGSDSNLKKLRGSLSQNEYEKEMALLQKGRNQWIGYRQ